MKFTSAFLLLVTLTATFAFDILYDRCDPKWVKVLQEGQLYDCADPASTNPHLQRASTYTLIATAFVNWDLTVKGKVATPDVIHQHFSQKWPDSKAAWAALKVKHGNLQNPTAEQINNHVRKGHIVQGIRKANKEKVTIVGAEPNKTFRVLSSRGLVKNEKVELFEDKFGVIFKPQILTLFDIVLDILMLMT
eukprot:TRINITY_DN904_c0_g1_i1.p1 TRINITY_DN904_c0_g1~~TRINITY_DN904_c0_g1_i1.p1  ORF type:complete len:192 (+),score=59.20 TRINITY_DN904_c0_g1_i1:131-706(+)